MELMNMKVLLVDDEKKVLKALQRRLQDRYNIYLADSGKKGLEIIENHGPFAVIISDYRMPQMDGIQFLMNSKKIDPDSVRIMLTGYPDMKVAVNAVNEGNIFFYLTKPSSTDQINQIVEKAIIMYNDRLVGLNEMVLKESNIAEKLVKPGREVVIDIKRKRQMRKRYQTKVAGLERDKLLVFAPVQSGKIIRLPEKEAARIGFEYEEETYVSPVIIIEHKMVQIRKGKKQLVVVTSYPEHIQVMPCRRYFRIEADLMVEIMGDHYRTIDISANGMLIDADNNNCFRSGDEIEVKLHLNSDVLKFIAYVVYVNEVSDSKRRIAFHFEDISRSHREILMRYIFKKQRELIQLNKKSLKSDRLDRGGL